MAIIALLLMVSFKVWSHGGRLNSEGCHNDTKAKQYHCHKANAKAGEKTDDIGNKTLGQSSLSGIYNRDIGVFDRLHRLYQVHS